MNKFFKNQPQSGPLPFISESQGVETGITDLTITTTAEYNADDSVVLLIARTHHMELKLTRDEHTSQLYIPLSSLVVLKKLCVAGFGQWFNQRCHGWFSSFCQCDLKN